MTENIFERKDVLEYLQALETFAGRTTTDAIRRLEPNANIGLGITAFHNMFFWKLPIPEVLMNHLRAAGASVNTKDYFDWTPLMTAVNLGSLHPVQWLLAHRADVNTTGRNASGEQYTIWTLAEKKSEITSLLLDTNQPPAPEPPRVE